MWWLTEDYVSLETQRYSLPVLGNSANRFELWPRSPLAADELRGTWNERVDHQDIHSEPVLPN